MSIISRITKDGIVYDARYRVSGSSSKHASKTFLRKSDAKEFLAKKSSELMGASLGASFDCTTLADEASFWLEQKKVELSGSWYRRATDIINDILIPKYGHLTPDKFTIGQIRKIQVETLDRVGRTGPIRPSSVNRVTEVLVAILNYSTRTRRIPFNPGKGYSKLPEGNDEMAYLELEEVKDLLGFLSQRFPRGHEERWVYVVFLVVLNCGLRAGEVWGLMPGDVKDETLHLKRQWLEVEKEFSPLKGKRNQRIASKAQRHTTLPPYVRQELLDVIKDRGVRSDETIFYGENRKPRGHRSFGNRFDRLIKVWGGKDVRFHDLRHTAITLWVHAGISLPVIQQMAGHESVTTTMGYVHMLGGSVTSVSRSHMVCEENERPISEPILLRKSKV